MSEMIVGAGVVFVNDDVAKKELKVIQEGAGGRLRNVVSWAYQDRHSSGKS